MGISWVSRATRLAYTVPRCWASRNPGTNVRCAETSIYLSTLQAPFGGVGDSGMGQYNGRFGFEEFSHKRHVLYRTTLLPLTMLGGLGIKEGVVPDWVAGFSARLLCTGFVPEWIKQVAKLVCAAGAALAAALVAQHLRQHLGL